MKCREKANLWRTKIDWGLPGVGRGKEERLQMDAEDLSMKGVCYSGFGWRSHGPGGTLRVVEVHTQSWLILWYMNKTLHEPAFFKIKIFLKYHQHMDGNPCVVDEGNWIDQIFLESSMATSIKILNIYILSYSNILRNFSYRHIHICAQNRWTKVLPKILFEILKIPNILNVCYQDNSFINYDISTKRNAMQICLKN